MIETKTLVIAVPKESKEVRMLYVFEGLSVLDGGDLETACRQMKVLEEANFNFFVQGTEIGPRPEDIALLRHFRFDAVRFFQDPARNKRRLCAYRSAAIEDREAFAKQLNKQITELVQPLANSTADEISQRIRVERQRLASPEYVRLADSMGMRALNKVGQGLLQLAEDFDLESIRKLVEAGKAEAAFSWIRFGPDTISIVLPITPKCAERIVADPRSKRWLEEMRLLAKPLQLRARDEGLTLVLGEQGKAIRLEITDFRPHQPALEGDIFRRAGNPAPLLIDNKAASSEKLIEQFLPKAAWEAFTAQQRLEQEKQAREKLRRTADLWKSLEQLSYAELLRQKPQLVLKMQDDPAGQQKLLALIENQKKQEALAKAEQRAKEQNEPAFKEREAARKLQIARLFLQDSQELAAKGKPKEAQAHREIAVRRLQEIADMFPGTKAAGEARALIEKAKGLSW